MPYFAGIHPTIYTKISLLLSLFKLQSFVPKISVTKNENDEYVMTLTFHGSNYRSPRRENQMYDTPSSSSTREDSQAYFQIDNTSSKRKTDFTCKYFDLPRKPKHKSPSKLNRDRARLQAFRERCCKRSEPPSAQPCSPNEDLSNLISRHIIEPIKLLMFILVFSSGFILLLCQ